jgi:hypothetical protein
VPVFVVYEWIPVSIVSATFLAGVVSECVEAQRFRNLEVPLS